MRKILTFLLFGLAVTLNVTASDSVIAGAWHDACTYSRYDCHGITPPFVVRAPIGTLYGRFERGTGYVVVNDDIESPRLLRGVIAHEMTHYLQDRNGLLAGSIALRCEMEKEAYQVFNLVIMRDGPFNELVNWEMRKRWYGCP